MDSLLVDIPLVRWGDLHLVVSLPAIERIARERLARVDAVSDLDIAGRDDHLELGLRVHWKGVAAPVRVEVKEIRVRHRRLGFRLGRLRVAGGLPVPRVAVLRALDRKISGLTVVEGTDVVVVDLRRWIPSEVDLRIVAVQVIGEGLHLWLASGSVSGIPAKEPQNLASGEPSGSLPEGGTR